MPTLPGGALPSTSSLAADSMSENVSSLQPPVRADKAPSPPTSGPGFLLTAPQGALKEGQWAPFPPAQAPMAFPFCLQGGPGRMSQKGVPGLSWAKAFGNRESPRGRPWSDIHGGKRRPSTTLHPLSPHQPPHGEPRCGPVPTLGQAGPSLTWDTPAARPHPGPRTAPEGSKQGFRPADHLPGPCQGQSA